MSDALPLPPRPNLEQYKKLAKELVKACASAEPGAIRAWAARWLEKLVRRDIVAPLYEPGNARFREHVTTKLEQLALSKLGGSGGHKPCALADAQLVIARGHGFASWPKFSKHIAGINRANSPVSKFEAAVDAIVDGDLAALKKLLAQNPELIRERSTREHRSTLLHYVSANGVEDFRQKTPANIVEITKLLLEAGADPNAESDAYGGRSTTLGLTGTSYHPEHAGVQYPLMDLLIRHGAAIDGPDTGSAVIGCLHNGRGQAAEFFAARGAKLDLEGAAGVGRLDVVKSLFNADGSLKNGATERQLYNGFAWACEFGRASTVEFLLGAKFRFDAELKHRGETGLHWAAYSGHAEIVKLLLARGAPVNIKDKHYGGTPLGWALYGWCERDRGDANRDGYYGAVAALVATGGTEAQEWLADPNRGTPMIQKIQADPRMLAALGGKLK